MRDVELRIDFRAALAKLAPAQLQGSWQLPTELTRLAIASGARSVELDLKKTRFTLKAAGAELDLVCLSELATLLDVAAPDRERHRALVVLEERDGLALAALAGLASDSIEVKSGGEGWCLSQAAGRRPTLQRLAGTSDLELKLQGVRLDATAAEHWLTRNGRFASVPIVIGGQPIARGFRRPLIRIRVRDPLPAAVAIAEKGELPRLWLLRYGIISTRATVPGYPAFEAAVEMSTVSPPGATSATLREAVQPHLESLVGSAVSLIGQLARHAESLREDARERAARLMLEASRRSRYRDELQSIRVFPQLVDGGKSRRLVSIADLDNLARFDGARSAGGAPSDSGGVARIDAISPDQDPNALALAGRQVLVLSSFERTQLAELLNVRFMTPPARPRARRSARHLAEEASGRLSLAWYRLRGRLLPESALSPGERAFLETLRRASADGLPRTVTFCAGDGRIHLTSDGRLLLPRRNQVVEASVRAVARDADWLYPVLTGLLGGHDLPSADLREKWTAAVAGHSPRSLAP